MPREYTNLCKLCPRSFLFAIVAKSAPGNNNISGKQTFVLHVDYFVLDTLALINILSDPVNHALLEAEKALAGDWYQQSHYKPQPLLPWRAEAEFRFTVTCLILGLLRDDSDSEDYGTAARPKLKHNNHHTRPGDVQLQPLATVIRGDCAEYKLVVLDTSDLDSVKYGYRGDPPPEREPDIVHTSPRPHVLLSVQQWFGEYLDFDRLENDPYIQKLEERPLVNAAVLDCMSSCQGRVMQY
ncbi:hypothetical protein BDW62DRAFT_215097 [Aspergillus aurantiobrunneus]